GTIIKATATEKDPNGLDAKQPGAKLDAGKSPVTRGVFQYFPKALRAIARVSEVGANKYSWYGWHAVDNGFVRYSDAMGRHILDEPEVIDPDTGLPHIYQTAWNALARLELWEEERLRKETNKDPFKG